jgi:dihydroorotate dehydrogenase (NAD+) catalytic subunit
MSKPDLRVKIGQLTMKNPVGVASGTFGYGSEYESLVDLSRLGAVYTKAVTMEPRPGNPIPRLVETPSGILNSIGLANPGIEAFSRGKLAEVAALPCARIVNVAGSSEADYVELTSRLESLEGIDGYELNVSCPNVRHGGLAFGTDPATVERVTRGVRDAIKSSRPLIVKLSPNVTDITQIAKAAEAGGADALTCVNTLIGMVIDVRRRRPAIPAGTAGLSGPAIRPVALACVYRVCRAVRVPVIGVGGIMCADDALQFLLAGAVAVQVGTGTFVDPSIPAAVLEGIESYMREAGVASTRDLASLMDWGSDGLR